MAALADLSPEACDRCGNFAPVTRSFELALCAECVRKSVHEIARTPLDFGHVVKGVGQLSLRIGVPAALVGIAIELPHAIAAQYVAIPGFVDIAWSTLTTLAADLVAIHLAWQVIRGRRSVDVRAALSAAGESFPRALMTRFVSSIQIGLLALLLVVPGIWRAIVLYLALPASIFENKASGDAISRSVRLMKPHFWLALLVAMAMLLPAVGIFTATSGVALVAAVLHPEGQPAWALGLAFVGELLTPVLVLPVTFAPVVIYAKLVPPAPDLR